MPDPTFEELYAQLTEAEHRSAAHEALIRAIQALDEASLPFRRFRGRKKLPVVKAQDKTRLMGLHQTIGAKAEALLAGQDSPELKELAKKIAALSSQNYKALLQYNPNTPRTLESLEEQSRTLVLHVGRNEFGQAQNLGANLSERMPLALYDDNGKKISGLFTKKKTLEVQGAFQKALDAALASDDLKDNEIAKTAFRHLRENIGKPIKLRHPTSGQTVQLTDDPAKNIYELLRMSTVGSRGKRKIDSLNLFGVIKQFLPNEAAAQFLPEMCFQLKDQLNPIRNSISMNFSEAKIPEGARLDNRNAAMSTVADLLGMPRIVARSRPMKIVDENGNEIEGTFMELARGMDVKNLSPFAQVIDKNALEMSTGLGFKDVANLQVLDYICGNVDRHGANMAYQFDPNQKFYGVQGFDNDCSFGTLVPASGEGKNRMVGTKNMRAIPAGTYRRVMQLTPATLKYALRGFGLSEEELNAAGQRLMRLQTDLRNEKQFYEEHDRENRRQRGVLLPGHTRILEDNEWKDYPEDQYSTELSGEPSKNAFALACSQVKNMSRQWLEQERDFKDLSRTIAAGVRNRAYKSTAAREQKKADDLKRVLSKRTWSGFSSENYRNMQAAVKNYLEAQKQLAERLKTANSEDAKRSSNYHGAMDAVVTQADLERLRLLSQRMMEAARTYLNGKLVNGQVPANASDYTKRRIEVAQQVLEYGRQGETIKPEETRKAQANEAEAGKQIAHRNAVQAADMPKTPQIPQI